MGRTNQRTLFDAPERPEPQPRPPSGVGGVLVVGGGCLFVYGALTVLAASLWGPGNSDQLVSSGPELIPWYGLPIAGTLAALLALVRQQQPQTAIWALCVAMLSLGAWTAVLYLVV